MLFLKRTDSNNPDFHRLTQQLDTELCEIYNTNQADYAEHNRITDLPTAVIAYADHVAVGCGCFKIYDHNTVEIKRMFVSFDFRGQGIATSIVKELEIWAVERNNHYAILETGDKQPEAISLYQKFGYEIIPNYGQYQEKDSSICMKKVLPADTQFYPLSFL